MNGTPGEQEGERNNEQARLAGELKQLREIAENIPRKFDLFFHPGKHLFFTFLKGVASGLGVIAAVAIVVPIVVAMLRGVQWIPVIGNFVNQIAEQMEQARGRR
jgi:hypothetical protein